MVPFRQKAGLAPLMGAFIAALGAYLCWLLAPDAQAASRSWLDPTRMALTLLTFALFGWSFIASIRPARRGHRGDDDEVTRWGGRPRQVALALGATLTIGLAMLPGRTPTASTPTKPRPVPKEGHARPELARVTLTIRNLTCRSCADSLQEALEDLRGVVQAQVQVHPPIAVIDYQPDQVTTATLVATSKRTGFPATIRR